MKILRSVLDEVLDHTQRGRARELLKVVQHQAQLRAESRDRVDKGDDEHLAGILAAVTLERLERVARDTALAQRLREVANETGDFIVVAVQRKPRDLPSFFHQVESPRTGQAGLAVSRRAGDQHQLPLPRVLQAFEELDAGHQLRAQARGRNLGLDQVH